MKIYVASPYRGSHDGIVRNNVEYAKKCCKKVLLSGHSVYAGHLQDTQYLDDNVPEEREAGLRNGLSFLLSCDAAIFFRDVAINDGMRIEMAECEKHNIPYTICFIDEYNKELLT